MKNTSLFLFLYLVLLKPINTFAGPSQNSDDIIMTSQHEPSPEYENERILFGSADPCLPRPNTPYDIGSLVRPGVAGEALCHPAESWPSPEASTEPGISVRSIRIRNTKFGHRLEPAEGPVSRPRVQRNGISGGRYMRFGKRSSFDITKRDIDVIINNRGLGTVGDYFKRHRPFLRFGRQMSPYEPRDLLMDSNESRDVIDDEDDDIILNKKDKPVFMRFGRKDEDRERHGGTSSSTRSSRRVRDIGTSFDVSSGIRHARKRYANGSDTGAVRYLKYRRDTGGKPVFMRFGRKELELLKSINNASGVNEDRLLSGSDYWTNLVHRDSRNR